MMTIIESCQIELEDPADNAQVIYTAKRLAARLGFDDTQQALIASAASELSTNIIRYAGKGRFAFHILQNGSRQGLEMIAQDEGPGIADIQEALQEHYSTGNGLGLGMPSVKRIMDDFEIDSQVGKGTHISVRKWR